ncbi:30S ribosomal protein S17 [bacterium]|nr:30S ribosomal protein S17 [bacterium]
MSEQRKERVGIVTSNKMDKTIAVRVERLLPHPLYGKVIKKAKKYIAHDEKNEAKIGDKVRIKETKPLSKNKCWKLVEIMVKAEE